MYTEPGFPVDGIESTELHATFLEESRTSLFSASAALQEIREAIGLFVVFLQEKPHLAVFARR
jgi:activator of HSP90 ATPase